MKSFTVPVFFTVEVNTPSEARELVSWIIQGIEFDEKGLLSVAVGNTDEVTESAREEIKA